MILTIQTKGHKSISLMHFKHKQCYYGMVTMVMLLGDIHAMHGIVVAIVSMTM